MENNIKPKIDSKIGLVYAFVVLFGNGVHPIINNSRPADLGGLIFSVYFTFWEFFFALIFFSVYKKQSMKKGLVKKIIVLPEDKSKKKKIIVIIIFICCLYSLATILYVEGLSLAGSISGSIALKAAPIFSLILGALILKEKIDFRLVFIVGGMIVALIYLGTSGTFQLDIFSLGFGMLLIVALFWSFSHAIAKRLMINNIISPESVIIIRTGFVFFSLFIVSLFTEGVDSILFSLSNSSHFKFSLLFGSIYFAMHISWYKSMRKLNLGYASAIVNPSPIITAILALIITQEQIMEYHIVGMVCILIGLYLMIYINNNPYQKKESSSYISPQPL